MAIVIVNKLAAKIDKLTWMGGVLMVLYIASFVKLFF